MRTPAWVITGLLDSGKTTLINRLVKEELNGLDVLVIQFETGEEKLQKGVKLHKMIFSKKLSGGKSFWYNRADFKICQETQTGTDSD